MHDPRDYKRIGSDRPNWGREFGAFSIGMLANPKNTTLSTDNDSASDYFHFNVRIISTNADGKTKIANYFVHRDRQRVAILAYADPGLAYAYMSNGVLLTLDRHQKRLIRVLPKGMPIFKLGCYRDGPFACNVGFDHRATEPNVSFALYTLICQHKSEHRIVANQATGEIKLGCKNFELGIVLADENYRVGYPAKSITIKHDTVGIIHVAPIATKGPPALRLLKLTPAALRSVGLSTAPIDKPALQELDLKIPADFAEDRSELGAADKWMGLFR